MKKKGHLLRNCIIVILVLSVIYWALINVLVSAVLVPSFMEKLDAFDRIVEQSYAEQVQESTLQQNAAAMYVIGDSWARQAGEEEIGILSEDGYRLKGVIFPAALPQARLQGGQAVETAGREPRPQSGPAVEEPVKTAVGAHRWVILLHGYTGSKEMMYPYAYRYVQHGFNALAPDFRCQGESEGDYIGLGATDSRDLLLWISMILQRDPDAEIVLHGLSMGASAALILSGKIDFMLMFMFLMVITRIYAPFDQSLALIAEMFVSQVSASRLNEIYDTPTAEGAETFITTSERRLP